MGLVSRESIPQTRAVFCFTKIGEEEFGTKTRIVQLQMFDCKFVRLQMRYFKKFLLVAYQDLLIVVPLYSR